MENEQKEEHSFRFGIDMQRRILRYMMQDREFCARCCTYLKADYFAGNLSYFFRKLLEHFNVYQDIMPPESLANEIQKHKAEDIVKFDLERHEICKVFLQPKDTLYVKNEMDGFIKQNIFVTTAKQAVVLYNSDQKDRCYTLMTEKMKELQEISFNTDRIMRFGNWEEAVDEANDQTRNAVPTGILEIDKTLGGGLLPGTWTTFLGGSNVGKSLLCVNLAYHAVMKGKKVFVTVHEDEENPTYLRYLARFSGIPYNYLQSTPRAIMPREIQETIEFADRLLEGNVRINFMYGRDSTIEEVQEAMRMMKYTFDYHLYLCDYGQCLKTRAFKTLDNSYTVLEHIYSELKQICLELKVAGAGGAQVNRSGHKLAKAGADYLRMTDVGDSWGICKKSSNVITMNRSESDIENNQIIFLLDKARNGKVPLAVQCLTSYDKCVTHDSEKSQTIISGHLKPVNEVKAEEDYEKKKKGETHGSADNVVPIRPKKPAPTEPPPPTPPASS
jgi:KaiC/GvpD/RAD55 family RecA-like ATPase